MFVDSRDAVVQRGLRLQPAVVYSVSVVPVSSTSVCHVSPESSEYSIL